MAQLRALYEAADDRGGWEGFCKLLILTGQRNSDLMNFSPNIMFGDEVHLPTSKNGTSHIIHLNHRAQAVVKDGMQWLGKKTFADMKRRWFEDAGIPLSFQLRDIRRSFATHMVENGADENVVDRILNHQAAATQASVKRTYNRAGRFTERRQVMYNWESLLLGSHKVTTATTDDWTKLATHKGSAMMSFGLNRHKYRRA
ncbi:tyrosine-type recombinase/integrase [uncultured Shimia sp.]|uniref:tyrosine-type recombinase/integrase n=1 Tax=uncultured Shimia sp. TaxID=573152 RepID=UPI0026114B00|nr:tyrosine-type recombinase/integrase [uncultured Shimia sp.]